MTHHHIHRPVDNTATPAQPGEQNMFGNNNNGGEFFNFFGQQQPAYTPHPEGRGHTHYGRQQPDSAANFLPGLGIDGAPPPQQHHYHGRGRHHQNQDDAERGYRTQPDTGMGSWNAGGSSSDAIARAAADSVGHNTYLPRPGSQYYGHHLSAGLGCTSASTNMFFDGLKAAGKVSDRDYARLHQVGNDAAYVNLQHLGVARPVSGNELKPGDWAYFKTPGHKHGHSGVVFEGANGELMVANNHSGTTIATPLSVMKQRYRTVRGLTPNV